MVNSSAQVRRFRKYDESKFCTLVSNCKNKDCVYWRCLSPCNCSHARPVFKIDDNDWKRTQIICISFRAKNFQAVLAGGSNVQ